MKVRGTGKQEKQRGSRLEIPYIITVRFHNISMFKQKQLLKTCVENYLNKLEFL